MWEDPLAVLDQGPCTSDVGVQCLCASDLSLQGLKSRHSAVDPDHDDPDSQKALLWLKDSAAEVHCTRLLLRAKRVFWDKPAEFHLEYGLYWDACGKLLGELARRQDTRGIASILSEIQQRFRIRAEHPWVARRHVITCLAEFGTHCASSVAAPDRGSFEHFWDTISYCLAHCRAAIDCLGGHHLATPDELTQSIACLVDLWFRLTGSLIREAQEAHGVSNATMHSETQLRLANLAVPLLELAIDAQLIAPGSVRTWNETVHGLIDHVNWQSQPEDMKRVFRDIIFAIDRGWARISNPADRNVFREVRDELLPKLQGRAARRRRKGCNLVCDAVLSVHGTALIAAKVHVRDICPLSYRAFRVETDDLLVTDFFEKDKGLRGETIDALYPCREIYVQPAPGNGAVAIDHVDLTIDYGGSGPLRFPCKVIRAWPKGATPSGISIRAQSVDMPHIPPEWLAFVNQLPDHV